LRVCEGLHKIACANRQSETAAALHGGALEYRTVLCGIKYTQGSGNASTSLLALQVYHCRVTAFPGPHSDWRAEQCKLCLAVDFSLKGSTRRTIWDRRNAASSIYKKCVCL